MSTSLIKKLMLPVLAIIMLLVMVAWMAGSFDDKIAPKLQHNSHLKVDVNSSMHHVVQSRREITFEPVSAVVGAKQATIISSRILSRIDKIKVRAGDTVKQGDLLISLEQSELVSQVSQAQEKIKGLSARYQEAEKNLARASEIYKKKLISTFELDKSKADFQSIDAELTAAKQALKQTQATLSYASIVSPINGKVVDRFAEPGDIAQPGNKLLALYNPLSLRVEANVREQLAIRLQQGQPLQVVIPSINKTLTAHIEEIVPAANTGSRSFLIKAMIDFNQEMMPGMYAKIQIPSQEQEIIYVPNNKLAQVGQLDFVWVLVNDELQRRFVRLGKMNKQDETIVLSGLKEGDILVNPPSENAL
jgi:RND family efflux transporter MFP subunit